jgi:ribonuclease BN (tRNA processing enzyme)
LAQGCDVLIHDQALPRRDMADGNLHSPPEDTAANAVTAGAHTLVLSHFMVRIENVLDDVVRRVAAIYGGQIIVAHDLLGVTSDGRVFGLGPG